MIFSAEMSLVEICCLQMQAFWQGRKKKLSLSTDSIKHGSALRQKKERKKRKEERKKKKKKKLYERVLKTNQHCQQVNVSFFWIFFPNK